MANQKLTLVTGGIKSGKSSLALKMGEEIIGHRAFIATALPLDDEMQQKIKLHQEERGSRWTTFEEPKDIISLIDGITNKFDVILIDCLTLWLSNLLTVYHMDSAAIQQKYKELIACLKKQDANIIIVTNEVGMGIIPSDSLSRSFQNLLGKLNREIAQLADNVFFMVSGLPVKVKP